MLKNTYKSYPNEKGYFGQFGGRYVSETLMPLILEVEKPFSSSLIIAAIISSSGPTPRPYLCAYFVFLAALKL